MSSSLNDVCYASLPREALRSLADIRCVPDIQVSFIGERAWVRWPPGREEVLRRLLPQPGLKLYRFHEGRWYPYGGHLPAFDLPVQAEAQALYQILLPKAVRVEPPATVNIEPLQLSLVPDMHGRATTAMLCSVVELEQWADQIPSARLASFRAARLGELILMMGCRLPYLQGNERFWGEQVLVPLGYRVEPDLPEETIYEVLNIDDTEVVVISHDGADVIPKEVFSTLTRTRVRLAHRDHH